MSGIRSRPVSLPPGVTLQEVALMADSNDDGYEDPDRMERRASHALSNNQGLARMLRKASAEDDELAEEDLDNSLFAMKPRRPVRAQRAARDRRAQSADLDALGHLLSMASTEEPLSFSPVYASPMPVRERQPAQREAFAELPGFAAQDLSLIEPDDETLQVPARPNTVVTPLRTVRRPDQENAQITYDHLQPRSSRSEKERVVEDIYARLAFGSRAANIANSSSAAPIRSSVHQPQPLKQPRGPLFTPQLVN
jgi:hypothetical protein